LFSGAEFAKNPVCYQKFGFKPVVQHPISAHKQKFIKLHETALICSNPNSRSSPSAVFTAFSPWKYAFSPIYKTAQNKKQYFVKFKRK
jgi:hypothetical protein